jgi:WD40 repeat protein
VIWQTGTWREIERLPRSDSQAGLLYVDALKFSPDGKLLAVGGPWHRITVWDWAARKEVRSYLDQSLGGTMPSLAFSPDGKMLAAPFHGITVWNMTTGKELRRFDARGDGLGGAHAVAFSPNGRLLALGGSGVILLVEPATGKIVFRFNLPPNSEKTPAGRQSSNLVTSMAFSRDGKSLLSGGYDAKLRLWEVDTGKERRLFQGHELTVHSVALSPDEKYAASASGSIWEHQDNSVRVWNVATGKELRKFTAHQSVVVSVGFSPDGKVLASGSEDGTTLI